MPITLSIPARINILGNPSDANEGDFATISAAVNLRAGARFESADQIILEVFESHPPKPGLLLATEAIPTPELRLAFPTDQVPLSYDGQFDLFKGAINRLYRFSSEFRQKIRQQGMRLSAWSEVPRQSGLGGSTLLVLLALAGLREIYNLDRHRHNDYVLSELAQRVEAEELNITCGFADRYVPLFGGLAYLDYRGKLHHKELGQEPYVTYERLDPYVGALPLVAAMTGIQHNSGDVHGRMRPRYLEEHAAWQAGGKPMPPMVRFMSSAWETAWRGKIALLAGDLPAVGKLMNHNHRIVDEMMVYCGFKDGAGWGNNLLIDKALENGAYGAKLTGAGGGGSVFALVPPGMEALLAEVWQQTAQEAGLVSARIYLPKIEQIGLIVTESD